MKKRVLRPIVEKVITAITILQLILICSLADFELWAAPIILLFLAWFGVNVIILKKYSNNLLTK